MHTSKCYNTMAKVRSFPRIYNSILNEDLEEETNYLLFSGVTHMCYLLLQMLYLFVGMVQLVLDLLPLLSFRVQAGFGLILGFTDVTQHALAGL